jgi:glycosyltransferase involved in cell wall biosynthesis
MMRLTLCWTDISGYMTANWRALSAMPDVELNVIAFKPSQGNFDPKLVSGINCRLLTVDERNNVELVEKLVTETRPDVLYLTGWFVPAYRKLIFNRDLDSVSRWIGVDTPWWGTLKQQIGRLVLPRLLKRIDRVFVAGERAWQYMRVLGVPQGKVLRGLYGVDYDAFAPMLEQRKQQPEGWPKRFLYTGRFAREKGLEILTAAYAKYRAAASEPWPLTCVGWGELAHLLDGRPGIENLGFCQPAELREVMRSAGVFVLPSHFDPWPLVIVESSAAGLPVVCTEACGSAVELIRPYYNGVTVPTADSDALARAMLWMHEHHAQLPEMGTRGQQLAAGYSAQAWATRWTEAARASINEKRSRSAS